MIRIVVDTNILVSALLQPRGFPAEILIEALAGERVQLCVSADIYAEYEEVIRRPRFKRRRLKARFVQSANRLCGSNHRREFARVRIQMTTFS